MSPFAGRQKKGIFGRGAGRVEGVSDPYTQRGGDNECTGAHEEGSSREKREALHSGWLGPSPRSSIAEGRPSAKRDAREGKLSREGAVARSVRSGTRSFLEALGASTKRLASRCPERGDGAGEDRKLAGVPARR